MPANEAKGYVIYSIVWVYEFLFRLMVFYLEKAMNIIQYDPSTDLNEVIAMLDGKDDIRRVFLNTIEKQNECTHIARYDNEIAGFLSVNGFDGRRADITVCVSERYRRKGIGSELLRSSDRFISGSAFEHAYCTFDADDGAANFLAKNGYRPYCSSFEMERDTTLIDGGKFSDASLLERGIIIRNYKDDDYIAYHNISDVAFFLLREKLCLTPSYYLPLMETERRRLANDCANRYVMIVNGVTTAIGAVNHNWIHLLAVRPDLQQRGYGRIMASYQNNKIIMNHNADKVKIGVLNGNPAKRLYEKLGFHEVRFTCDYIKYYKTDSRPRAPKGYANEEAILNELRLHGMLRGESFE